jgi:transcriptional regulator
VYRPSHFAWTDRAAVHDLLEEEGFGVVEVGEERTPIPFVLDRDAGPFGRVRFHVARANPIASRLDGARASLLVVGPHRYVSPAWYASRSEHVPTWNYLVVVGEGIARRLDRDETLAQVRDLALAHEEGEDPWSPDELEPGLRDDLLRGIVAFAMPLDVLVGKAKCSQNREREDRDRVLARLEASPDPGDARLLRWMRRATGPARA